MIGTSCLATLYEYLNHSDRHSTPEMTVEAIMFAIREDGVSAVREPDTRERLQRCDDNAKEQLRQRAKKLGFDVTEAPDEGLSIWRRLDES